MPTDSRRKSTPKPRNIEANRLISNSLKMTLSFLSPLFLLGRLTSNTKNHAVKKVPMVTRTVASIGNAAGEIGDIYRTIESILCVCG